MTAPFVPTDLDLRDFPNMPLDVVRLRDSDLSVTATGDQFRAAILLWCAAWHQVPASSLPDDDRLLARFAGYGRDLRGWKAVRSIALHGFIKCSDGRLYHPVIGDMALNADKKRKNNSRRTAAATTAAAAARREMRDRDVVRNGRAADNRNGTQEKRIEEKRIEDDVSKETSSAAAPSKSTFSDADFDLTKAIMRAWGLHKADPRVMGTTYFANKWLGAGWQPDLIVATIERVVATKRDGPPNNLRYFEKPIADAHAELARPVPQGTATGPPRRERKSYAEIAIELEQRAAQREQQGNPDPGNFTVIDGTAKPATGCAMSAPSPG